MHQSSSAGQGLARAREACPAHGVGGLQGVPVLVSLVEERVGEAGYLTQMGLTCIWRVLDLQGAIPLNHLCRCPAHLLLCRGDC